MTGEELRRATGGHWHGTPPELITGIGTDTRAFTPGHAFLALRGPRFDGHRFAPKIEASAAALIGDAAGRAAWRRPTAPVLEVEDTLRALGDAAHAWRRKLAQTTFVAVSGSFGKTTVRDMLRHVLNGAGVRVHATRGNLNNLIGVPHTLLETPDDAEVAVVECGISEPGEMARLTEIVAPDVAVLTGLGEAHGAGLGGAEGVAREKGRLLAGVASGGWCALGEGVAARFARLGIPVTCDALDMDTVPLTRELRDRELTFRRGDETARLTLPLPAPHIAADMALSLAVATRLLQTLRPGLEQPLAQAAAALADWRPPAGRMRPRPGPNGSTIIDDAYNANPASMRAALATLRALPGRRHAVLGEMAELGADAAALHAGLDVDGLDGLVLVGPLMRELAEAHPGAIHVGDAEAAVAACRRWPLAEGDYVLVKASRSAGLDAVVGALAEEAGDAL